MRSSKNTTGMSLIGLATTLAVLAILLGSGVPTFVSLSLDNHRTAAINELVSAVQFARSESAKRNREVVLCPDAGVGQCLGRRWESGWLVFANLDGDSPPRLDPGEPLLYVHPGAESLDVVSNRSAFRFRPLGVRSVNGTVVFCDRRGASSARAVIISYTGRPRVSDRDASGKSLVCP